MPQREPPSGREMVAPRRRSFSRFGGGSAPIAGILFPGKAAAGRFTSPRCRLGAERTNSRDSFSRQGGPLVRASGRTNRQDSFSRQGGRRVAPRAVPSVRIVRRSCRVVLRPSISPLKKADSGLPQREPPSSREMAASRRRGFSRFGVSCQALVSRFSSPRCRLGRGAPIAGILFPGKVAGGSRPGRPVCQNREALL